jgi:hypothetical protein
MAMAGMVNNGSFGPFGIAVASERLKKAAGQ